MLIDRDFVLRWAHRYVVTLRPRDRAEEEWLEADIGPAVRARGWYTVPELRAVNRWKLPTQRNRERLLWNRTEAIERITREARAATDPGEQSLIMQCLHGVGVAVASALLMFPEPERHTVIDFRAVEALQRLGELPAGAVGYPAYLAACQDLADRLGVSLRALDRALWCWHLRGMPAATIR